MKILLISALAVWGFTADLSAAECQCQSVPGSAETILRATPNSGNEITLRFAASPVTTATNLAFLCVEQTTAVNEVKLWMPDMGHGSSPTRIVAIGDCHRVERVNFIMPGLWDLKIKLAENDPVTLSLEVSR